MPMRALALLVALAAAPAAAQGVGAETGRPLPRFESLRFEAANMRRGAGEDYPIAWQYRRRGLPVEVLQEWGDWRRVRDPQGESGWMKRTQLTARRTVVTTAEAVMREAGAEGAAKVARAEAGAVLDLLACGPGWCEARAQGFQGWLPKAALWGVGADEAFAAED